MEQVIDLLSSLEAEGIAELTSEQLDSFEKSNWLKKVSKRKLLTTV